MSLPFDRSIRALQSGQEWPALALLASAGLLLMLWTIWFLTAPIARYETGKIVGTTRAGAFIANFSSTTASALQPGQVALLRWRAAGDDSQASDTGGSDTPAAVPALVMLVDQPDRNGQVAVELAPLLDLSDGLDVFAAPDAGGSPTLTAEVEVERLSPAQWVWRASGQWIDSAQVVLRPQTQ